MTEDWAGQWDIAGAVAYITGRGYTTVALQFPDELLDEAAVVSQALQGACAAAGQEIEVGLGSWPWLHANRYQACSHYESTPLRRPL